MPQSDSQATRRCLWAALPTFFLALAGMAFGDIAPPPRVPPTEPADAVKTFTLAPGFRIELVASEPQIRSPVAIDFDEDGRLYVAEFPEYNLHDDPTFREKGAIKRLEDRDGDGVYETAMTFVDNLPAPTAVACWNGGVFVGSVPHLLECKDVKGTGKADVREVVYVGFDRDRAGEGMLNSIRWGLDNRFRLSTSSAGGSIRRGDDKAAKAIGVRNRFLLFDPRSRSFEAISGHGQHGMSMDDWGNWFVCDNSNPIHHVVYDGRYAARNPSVAAPPVAVNVHEQATDPKLVRTSPLEAWRVERTKLRVAGKVKGPTEGGRVGGHFTGTTGVTIYRGDAFPAEMRGQAFVGEVSNNLLHRMTLTPKGVGFVARRADTGREFLASKDNWFRPSQLANGPDGCLYVVDTYRELIETVESIPPEIRKKLDPRAGFDRGRIWRIVPDGHVRRAAPKLSGATTAELVALLDHANGWHRDTASRLLMQRQDRSAVPLLTTLAKAAKTPQGRMHAMWSLAGFDALNETVVLDGMNDDDAHVREHAVKLAERFADRPAMVAAWRKRTADDDLRVRWQTAFSLGASSSRDATDALALLVIANGDDPRFRFAILSSSKDRAGALVRRLVADKTERNSPHVRKTVLELATAIGQSRRNDDVATLLEVGESLQNDVFQRDLIAALIAKMPAEARVRLTSATAKTVLASMLDDARRIAGDAKRSPAERAAAAHNLRLGAFADVRPLCEQLLQPTQPEAVQKAGIAALSTFDEPAAAELLLDAWPSMTPIVRAAAAEAIFARTASTTRLLDRIERGDVKPGDLDPGRVSLLRETSDPALRKRVETLFKGAGLSKRADVIAKYKVALETPGDVDRGRVLFRKHCTACHQREGVGQRIGADLAGIGPRGAEFLLVNILDPNREVLPKFLAYQAETKAGRLLTGLIQEETATSLTIRRLDGTGDTILREDLASLRSTGLSFMPEGFETQISPVQMADLIAYLLATP